MNFDVYVRLNRVRPEKFRAEAATMSETAVVDRYFHRSNAMSEWIEQWTKMTFDERMHLPEIIFENRIGQKSSKHLKIIHLSILHSQSNYRVFIREKSSKQLKCYSRYFRRSTCFWVESTSSVKVES